MIGARLRLSTTMVPFMFAVTSGCYASYTGIYFVKAPKQDLSITLEDLGHEVGAAVRPFGLHGGEKIVGSESVVFFGTRKSDIEPQFAHLKGAGASISVSVSIERWIDRFKPFYISIRDFSNREETDFMQALKRSIEHQLVQRYGISELEFERQWDMFL